MPPGVALQPHSCRSPDPTLISECLCMCSSCPCGFLQLPLTSKNMLVVVLVTLTCSQVPVILQHCSTDPSLRVQESDVFLKYVIQHFNKKSFICDFLAVLPPKLSFQTGDILSPGDSEQFKALILVGLTFISNVYWQ